ncbi:MAG: hypothetical protein Q9N68_06960, partial [Gammaproteobacteria bacterium]|nr:hypothetical protein [Gammaproteobacteria bacterium]
TPMKVVPAPKSPDAAVLTLKAPNLAMAEPFSVIQGQGHIDYTCGSCGVTVAENMRLGQLTKVLVKCKNCNSFNIVG